jgi:hypothetical protein
MIRGLFGFLLILLAIHIGYKFTSPVIKNTMLQGKMEDLVQASGLKGERGLRIDTMEFVHDKHIPLQDKDLVVNIDDNGKATIAAHYSCDATFWFYTRHYEFYPASSPAASLEVKRANHQTVRHGSTRRAQRAGY